MLYLKIPFQKPILRAMAKNNGAKWNDFMRLWEIDSSVIKSEKDLPRKLRRYIVFSANDLSCIESNLQARSKRAESIYTTLSVREVNFMQQYLKNLGNSRAAAEAIGLKKERGYALEKKILAKPAAQKWLAAEIEKMSIDARWTYEEKSAMLKKIAQTAVPMDATTIKEMAPTHAISAIAEHNKMSGDYSAEKRVNVNLGVDTDIEEVKKLTAELMAQNKREY